MSNRGGRGGAWVAGSPALLSRMVDNVIDNAVAHNYDGGWIQVTTGANGFAWLVVETGGPVLDQRQVAQLAQPFRRLGADRTGSDRGAGLGLSIVAAIAGTTRRSTVPASTPIANASSAQASGMMPAKSKPLSENRPLT